jgi:hypothetical protein
MGRISSGGPSLIGYLYHPARVKLERIVGTILDFWFVERGHHMRRPRRPSLGHRLLEAPLRLLFGLVTIVVRIIIFVRRLVPLSLLLLLCALVPLVGFSLRRLDSTGAWLLLAAALALAFAEGSLRTRR